MELITKQSFAAEISLSDIFGFGHLKSFADLINAFIAPIFAVVGLLILFYIFYAGWKYLTSGGNKEELAKARAMITHAIIGVLMLIALFLVIQFVPEFLFGATGGFQVINR